MAVDQVIQQAVARRLPQSMDRSFRKQATDSVNQIKPIEITPGKIKDGRVISLIHKYLRAGAVNCGKFEDTPGYAGTGINANLNRPVPDGTHGGDER